MDSLTARPRESEITSTLFLFSPRAFIPGVSHHAYIPGRYAPECTHFGKLGIFKASRIRQFGSMNERKTRTVSGYIKKKSA